MKVVVRDRIDGSRNGLSVKRLFRNAAYLWRPSDRVSKFLSLGFLSVYEISIFEKVRYQGWYGEVLELQMDLHQESARNMMLLNHHFQMESMGKRADDIAIKEIASTMEEKRRQLSRLEHAAGDQELIELQRQCLQEAFDKNVENIVRRLSKPK